MLLLVISCIQQCLILRVSPYESNRVNQILLFNEVAVSLNLYLSLLLTDYLSQQLPDTRDIEKLTNLRLIIAWVLTFLLIATILVNLVHTAIHLTVSFARYLKTKVFLKKVVE